MRRDDATAPPRLCLGQNHGNSAKLVHCMMVASAWPSMTCKSGCIDECMNRSSTPCGSALSPALSAGLASSHFPRWITSTNSDTQGACLYAGIDLAKILGLVVVGMPVTLLVTAQVAILIRHFSATQLEPPQTGPPPPAFTRLHHLAWGATWLTSLAAVAFSSSGQVWHPPGAGPPV